MFGSLLNSRFCGLMTAMYEYHNGGALCSRLSVVAGWSVAVSGKRLFTAVITLMSGPRGETSVHK